MYNLRIMFEPLLLTKLCVPPGPLNIVSRPRLIERLNEALQGRFTLISAPAGFGKTTLVSEWIAMSKLPVAWVSLDEGDNDLDRFLMYVIAALRTVKENIGDEAWQVLQTLERPSTESILTVLLNDVTSIPDQFTLVLDDYHLIDSRPIDEALTYLIEHQPPNMHLVIVTRQDPDLHLARLRTRSQLIELRRIDLRFTTSEVAEFLNRVMGLNLSAANISALEARTEGWIAGLQLAAISMKGHKDNSNFIKDFTGSNHFVIDYLVEEVLQQQPERIQTFLLKTSILDRFSGPLCDAVLDNSSVSGEETLAYLEKANLFVVPLDNERHWYRYHRLFTDLLRQRLQQNTVNSSGNKAKGNTDLHIRASQWYEDNHMELEAFHHAALANDVERAERLLSDDRISQHFRSAGNAILDWMEALPTTVLVSRPWLEWRYASLLLVNGRTNGVEEKLQATESSLQFVEADDETRNLIGQIATARAIIAFTQQRIEDMLIQSRRALEYLPASSLISRSTAYWTLGYAYQIQGDRPAARLALTEAILNSQKIGDMFTTNLATISLGKLQEMENHLLQAAESYELAIQRAGNQPFQIVNEAHLGLARVLYEWNDLDGSQQHLEQSVQLLRKENTDKFVASEVLLARLNLAQGNIEGAASILAKAELVVQQCNLVHQIPEIAAAQVMTLLNQGNLEVAAHVAHTFTLPISQVRVHLASGNTSAALALLEPLRQEAEAKGWEDEQLRVMVLQVVALGASGYRDKAIKLLSEVLELAEPGGFIRIFVNEGVSMAQLLSEVAAIGIKPNYVNKLLAAFESEKQTGMVAYKASQGKGEGTANLPPALLLDEPLSRREIEVLGLISQGLSNREIGKQLFLSLNTIKGHNQKIFSKLGVQSRTEAIVRAHELNVV